MTHFLDNQPVEGNTYRGIKPKSGTRGVVFEPRSGRWGARAYIEGRMQWIGTFDTADQAKAAVEDAKAKDPGKPKAPEKVSRPTSVNYLKRRKLSVEDIRMLVKYNAETGEFFWGPRPIEMCNSQEWFDWWHANMVGEKIVGRVHKKKHKIPFRKKSFYAHDIAWAITHGRWPSRPIIHINGDTLDNRISNLMEASQ